MILFACGRAPAYTSSEEINRYVRVAQAKQMGADTTRTPQVGEQEQITPSVYTPDCSKPKDHDEADLCLQRRMTQTAEEALQVARQQSWIGGISLLFVIASLVLTAWAAWAATQAASTAKIAISITQKIGEAQVRAYLYLKSARYQRRKDSVSAILEIGNAGQSPASDIKIGGSMAFHEVGGFRSMPRVLSWLSSTRSESGCQPIFANSITIEEIIFFRDMDFAPGEEQIHQDTLFDSGNEIWFDLELRWRDVFGEAHELPVYLSAVIDASPSEPRKNRSTAGKLNLRMSDMRHQPQSGSEQP